MTELITSSTDLFTSTAPGSDKQIEMFEKGMGPEMSMEDFLSFVKDEYGMGSVHQALQIAAFMLCCDVIAQDIAKSTLRLRERLENGTSRIVMPTAHPLAGLLALEPNRRHTWIQYAEMTVLWYCISGESYSGILRSNAGDPLELIPFQTGRVQDKVNGREIFYDVQANTLHEQALMGGANLRFAERDMIHVRKRMLDGMSGSSTIDFGRTTLDTANKLERYRAQLFSEHGQMRGVFTSDKVEALDETSFNRLRSQFKALMNKFIAGTEPIVLEQGIKFNSISANPKEIELNQQVEAQINEMCRLLRVPPHKVFLMSGTKYENLETQEKMYVGDTLVPVAENFEQSMGRVLLSRKDRLRYFLEFDRNEMTLRDTKLETERAIRALERGAIEIDEARAVFGYNPLPDGAGQVRLVPANMVLVDRNNEPVLLTTTAPPATNQQDPADEQDDTVDNSGDAGEERSAPVLRVV